MRAVVLKKIRSGKYYRPGDEIELDEAEYSRLLKLGAVRVAADGGNKPPAKTAAKPQKK